MTNAHWSERIARRLKLKDLRIFMAVVQAGSMGKAARDLTTVQPAVSRAIADLEREVGFALLERSGRGVTPNKFGRALAASCSRAFGELDRGLKTIAFLNDPSAGELTMAGNESIIAGLVPAVFNRLRSGYPGISIRVEQVTSATLQAAALRDGKVDLVLGRIPDAVDDDIAVERLYDEHSVVVAGANSPWARRRKLDFAELANEPWALPDPTSLVGSIFANAFKKAGFAYPSRNVAFGHIHLHMTLAASGQFLAVLPRSLLVLGQHRDTIKILPVRCPVSPWPVGLMTLKGGSLAPVPALFVEQARALGLQLQRGPHGAR